MFLNKKNRCFSFRSWLSNQKLQSRETVLNYGLFNFKFNKKYGFSIRATFFKEKSLDTSNEGLFNWFSQDDQYLVLNKSDLVDSIHGLDEFRSALSLEGSQNLDGSVTLMEQSFESY